MRRTGANGEEPEEGGGRQGGARGGAGGGGSNGGVRCVGEGSRGGGGTKEEERSQEEVPVSSSGRRLLSTTLARASMCFCSASSASIWLTAYWLRSLMQKKTLALEARLPTCLRDSPVLGGIRPRTSSLPLQDKHL